MKKLTLSVVIAGMAFSSSINAQVGINTASPASTLDVTAKNATGVTTNVDGLLIPRVDRQRAQSMTTVPTSTLIYVNDISTGTQTGTALNIDTVGHYSYNGTVWTKITPATVNIYNSNGTLTGNRVVTQGANTLAFTTTAVNGFSVAGSTLSVDGANNRVGIGTAAPNAPLQFANATGNRKIVMYETANNDQQFYGFGVDPGILRYQADVTTTDHVFYAGASTTTSNELMRIKGTGNVGIGTNAPTSLLDVNGNTRVRTINPAAGTTIVTPVYADPTGVLVKASPSVTYGGVVSGSVTVGSGATAALVTGMLDGGVYKTFVTVGDGCAYVTYAEYIAANNSFNGNFCH